MHGPFTGGADGQTDTFIGDFATPAGGLQQPHGIDFLPEGILNLSALSIGGSTTPFSCFGAETGDKVTFALGVGVRQRVLPLQLQLGLLN
ncbi:MAG: hypothetical protein ACI835_004926 [Planctomycetota bacterium]